jgi:hypothetical protein
MMGLNLHRLIKGRGHGRYGRLNQLAIGGTSLNFSQGALSASRLSFRAALRDLLLYLQ